MLKKSFIGGATLFSVLVILSTSLQASGAKLFYLEPSKGKCDARILNFPNKISQTIFSTAACPNHIIIASDSIYFTMGNKIFLTSLKIPLKTHKIFADFPFGNDAKMWLDSKNKSIKAAYLKPVPEGNYEVRNDNFIFSLAGKKYEVPAIGTPWIAFALELREKKWELLETAPSNWEAGDTLGFDALETFRRARMKGSGTSLGLILEDMTCRGDLKCDSLNKEIGMIFGKEKVEDASVLRTNTKNIYFGLYFGDTLHPGPPVYLCDQPCKKPKKIDAPFPQQIGLAVKERFLLINEEHSGNHPRVFDLVSGEQLVDLSSSQMAVWVP